MEESAFLSLPEGLLVDHMKLRFPHFAEEKNLSMYFPQGKEGIHAESPEDLYSRV
jgi:hypothetical protein